MISVLCLVNDDCWDEMKKVMIDEVRTNNQKKKFDEKISLVKFLSVLNR